MTLRKKHEICNLVKNFRISIILISWERGNYTFFIFFLYNFIFSLPLFIWVLKLLISDCRRGVMLGHQHLGSFEGQNVTLMVYSFSL